MIAIEHAVKLKATSSMPFAWVNITYVRLAVCICTMQQEHFPVGREAPARRVALRGSFWKRLSVVAGAPTRKYCDVTACVAN